MSEPSRLDELNEIGLWQSPPMVQMPDASALRDIAGAEAQQDLRPKDKAVVHVYGTDQSALPPLGNDLAAFGEWSSVGSTLWNKVIQLAGFDPSTTDFNSPSFSAFKTKFATSPFWNGIEFNITHRTAQLKVRNYNELVNAVADLVSVGTSPDSREGIINGVRKIAQLASRNVRSQTKDTLGQNSAMSVYNGRLYMFFLFGTVEMTAQQRKYTIIDQRLDLYRGYGVLDLNFCRRHASSLLRYDKRSLPEWEGDAAANAEPINNSEGW